MRRSPDEVLKLKPRIFLASSTPQIDRMRDVAGWLKGWGADPVPWNEVGLFNPGDFILERLLEISQEVDAAVILFGDEDKEWYHADAQPQPRDNVLIEYGIFASQLGRERVVVCRSGNPKNASDLGGLIFLQLPRTKAGDEEARDRLRAWVRKLPELMTEARQALLARKEAANAPVPSGVDAAYRLPGTRPRELRIQTGPLKDIRNIDVIVSSENTDLQPARFYDRSMSGTLRYLDGDKNKMSLRVRRDVYMETLLETIKAEDVQLPVMAGSVLPMATHGLREQGVKFVFQAAVVEGKVGLGYEASETAIEDAVQHSFARFNELAVQEALTSILFPMFGAGSGRLSEDGAAERIVHAIEGNVDQVPQLETVHLYAYVESHRVAFRRAVEKMKWARI